MSRSRLIRRPPFSSRLKNYLNPLDFLLWLSEQVEGTEWEEYQRAIATPVGIGCNLMFLVARANSGAGTWKRDDVFGDEGGGRGWWSWFASFVVHFLTLISILNAVYAFNRKRRYRLFETSIDVPPSTPSAHRVRVDSSPLSSSPLRFLSTIIDPLVSSTAESRSHPSASRDVWEIAVWDPTPLSLRLFCFFSPGHMLIYWLLLPTTAVDPRPSTTVLTTIIFASLLTAQLLFLQRNFSQQSKDTALIHKEVLHEYDTKYVHPRLNPQVRDVATQFSANEYAQGGKGDVQLYTPTTIIKREFQTRPNPNYVKHVDPESTLFRTRPPSSQISTAASATTTSSYGPTTPFLPRHTTTTTQTPSTIHQPQFRPPPPNTTTATTGDGGSLGVYTHANSPYKKPNFLLSNEDHTRERSRSPTKRSSAGGVMQGVGGRPARGGPRYSIVEAETPSRRLSGRF